MLKEISVKNLGCFNDKVYTAEFSEETVLVGPNNSGKSMTIAGLNLLRWFIVQGGFSWTTEFYTLVNFENSIHLHEQDRRIEISATLVSRDRTYKYEIGIGKGGALLFANLNNQPLARSQEDIKRMQEIWYIRPNRAILPFSTPVQPTGSIFQPLSPDGSNVINYLLQRFTERDEKGGLVEKWLRKIDPEMSSFKTPVRGNQSFLETMIGNVPINACLQGSGIQSVACIISAVIFSPEGSTILIEEPEVCLHPRSQEVLVDMFNEAVLQHQKQIIFSTHSWDMLLPFISDIGEGTSRGAEHVTADTSKFKLLVFNKVSGKPSIQPCDIAGKKYIDVRNYFKELWG